MGGTSIGTGPAAHVGALRDRSPIGTPEGTWTPTQPSEVAGPTGPTGPADAATALPVDLAVGGAEAEAVGAWVEGVLGWQVSDPTGQDPVPPVLRIVGLTGAAATLGSGAQDELPTLLLVPDAAPPATAAAEASRLQPAAVLGWPSQREELPELATALLSRPRGHRSGGPAILRVGGSAGGVGTTTVALALAGLKAWGGRATLVAVRGHGMAWCPVPTAALGGSELWAAADPLPGFDGGLRAVRLVDVEHAPPLRDPAISAVVLDLGSEPDCDVLVCRPDAAGLAAMAATAAAAVVLVGSGPVPRSAVERASEGRRRIELPSSARVARAALQGRVPAGLPGTFVARLAPLLGGARSPGAGGT